MQENQTLYNSIRNSKCQDLEKKYGPIILPNGTIRIRFWKNILVDITTDKAIRVINKNDGIAMAISNDSRKSSFTHPNGRFYQSGSCADIVTISKNNSINNIMYTKMCKNSISFTQKDFPIALMVDRCGTRMQQSTFLDLRNEMTLDVFYMNSKHGPNHTKDAIELLNNIFFDVSADKIFVSENSNNFRMVQAANGALKVTWNRGKNIIRTGSRTAALTTSFIHCTASLGETSHFFVRNDDKRMHFDGNRFCVRYEGHSAGFDENDLLYIY